MRCVKFIVTTSFAAILLFCGGSFDSAEALLAQHDCSFCHSFHGGPSFGALLTAAESEAVCLSCHFERLYHAPYGPEDYSEAVAVHNPRGLTSNDDGYITCRECHDAHSNRAGNVKLVGYRRDEVNWASSFTAPGIRKEMTDTVGLTYNVVTFTGSTDFNIAGSAVGACEACHPVDHAEGGDCTGCHDHAGGFGAASCTGCHGTDPKQYPPVSAAATTGSDDAIGAHVVHIEKTATLMSKEVVGGEADLVGYWCAECHTTTRGAGGHNDAYPAEVLFTNAIESKYGSVTAAFTAEATIDNGVGGSCVTYCHSAYDGVAEKAGTNTQPNWTDLWANYGDGTPACSTACHLTPPFAGTTHDALAANDLTTCNGCHPDTVTNSAAVPTIGTASHINGSIEASGDCNACHGYPSANGAHNKHAAKFEALGVGTLATSVTDTDWTAAAHPICAKCHDMSVAGNHTDETLPWNVATPFDVLVPTVYQFRSGTPTSYDSARASQSCSSVECHFKPSPDWDTSN